MAEVTRTQKKELAKLLFTRERLTQKEAAARADVSETTMSKWVVDGGWKNLRDIFSVTNEEMIRTFYMHIGEVNDAVAAKIEGQRYPDSKQSDTIVKLTSAIRNLQTELGIAEAVTVGKDFATFVRSINPEFAKSFVDYYHSFIQSKLK